MSDDWSLKEYHLVDSVNYYPDCDHMIVSKQDINYHNSIADDLIDCNWCQGTGENTHDIYKWGEDKKTYLGVEHYHYKGTKCAFCDGTGKKNRHRKFNIQSKELYWKEDIEILRKKLIEDVLRLQDEVGNDYMITDPFQNAIIDAINKRFGVEDD